MGRNRAHTWASRYTGRACSMLAKRVGRVPQRIMPIPHKRAARASARVDFQAARAAESTQKYRGLSH